MGSRSSSKSSSRNSSKDDEMGAANGPERFFYDRSTYTGVHRHGGPTTKGSGGFALQLRPSMHLGSTFTCSSGHPLDQNTVRSLGAGTGTNKFSQSLRGDQLLERPVCPARHVESIAERSLSSPRPGENSQTRRARSLGAASYLSSPVRGDIRALSKGSTCDVTGPERFFYDKTSYTGVHKRGGPDTLDGRDAWALSMRSGMH